mgnify:CR=1 FL=1
MNYINKNIISIIIFLFLVGCGSSLKDTVITVMNNSDFTNGDPDEFMTVTKSPLTMPPDYQLRPPEEGANALSQKEPSVLARSYILRSESDTSELSTGEQNILKKANVEYANPRIKEELSLEEGIISKDESLSDYLIRLKRKKSETLDAYTEIERLNTSKSEVKNILYSSNDEDNVQESEAEVVNLNKLTLERLRNKTTTTNNDANLKYGVRSEDLLKKNSDITKNDNNEIPPIDKQTTVLKGLMGGLMGGFGIF